jgi:hypothetical protein
MNQSMGMGNRVLAGTKKLMVEISYLGIEKLPDRMVLEIYFAFGLCWRDQHIRAKLSLSRSLFRCVGEFSSFI